MNYRTYDIVLLLYYLISSITIINDLFFFFWDYRLKGSLAVTSAEIMFKNSRD